MCEEEEEEQEEEEEDEDWQQLPWFSFSPEDCPRAGSHDDLLIIKPLNT